MLAKLECTRELRGESLAINGLIERVSASSFMVHSQTSNREYVVSLNGKAWSCSCPDHQYRHVECKHIHAVEALMDGEVE
jgi:predicted nucleic acid-binding Zn finger protein